MQSNVSSDVIFDPKEIKFSQFGKLKAGFRWSKKRFSSVKNCKFQKCHQPPYDTHPSEVINSAKFDVCMPSSFGGEKQTDIHKQTELRFIMINVIVYSQT